MGIKRWLLLVFIGELSLALGGAFALRQLYRDTDVSGPFQASIYVATLQFLHAEADAFPGPPLRGQRTAMEGVPQPVDREHSRYLEWACVR